MEVLDAPTGRGYRCEKQDRCVDRSEAQSSLQGRLVVMLRLVALVAKDILVIMHQQQCPKERTRRSSILVFRTER